MADVTVSPDMSLMHAAICNGHLHVVKHLMKKHLHNPLYPATALHIATAEGQLSIVKHLTSMFTLTYGDRTLIKSLHFAALSGHLDVVKFFIEDLKCDPNSKDQRGRTALHYASQKGYLDVVKYLVDTHHSDPLCIDRHKHTPFDIAASNAQLKVIRYFSHYLDQKLLSRSISNSLHFAALNGDLEMVKFFVEGVKCDLNCKDSRGRTPLHHASQNGNLDVVKYLVGMLHCDSLCPTQDTNDQFTNDQNLLVQDSYKNTPLHFAAFSGHLEVVKFFIEVLRCDPNCEGRWGRTPLHDASQNGNLDVVKYLMDTHHCDPLCPDENKGSPVHTAAANGQLEVIKYFISLGCNLLVRDRKKNTPLHLAARDGHLEVVKFFTEDLDGYYDPKGQWKRTPLHFASQNGHLDIVKYLVCVRHCSPSCQDEGKETPLHTAAAHGRLEVVKYLTRALNLDHTLVFKDDHKNTPLHLAALSGHLEVVKFFTEVLKCDPNLKGRWMRTPLHDASQNGHIDVVKYLVNVQQCDPFRGDEKKESSLHTAAAHGRLEVVKFLTLHSDDTPFCDLGNAPLHLAALNGHFEVVKFFIDDVKCNPNLQGQRGRTPLHHASVKGHLDIVKYLVDAHHCSPLCPDESHSTPLHRAAAKGWLEIIQYFAGVLGDFPTENRNKSNDTPLHDSVRNGYLDVTKLFIEDLKCDPNLKGQHGRTPLHHASAKGHFGVVKYLMETHDCDPLCPDERNQTPLHIAAANGKLEVVRYLMEAIHRNFLDGDETLLHFTSTSESDVVEFFMEDAFIMLDKKKLYKTTKEGAIFDIKVVRHYVESSRWFPKILDRDGNNPLHSAAEHGHFEVVKYLTDFFKTSRTAGSAILCDPLLKNKHGLTAQDLALSKGHNYSVSTEEPVSGQYAITPTISIFVLGNSGSGKSTLVQALSTEGAGLLGKLIKVKGVLPLTAGIVPTNFYSEVFGRVNIYDFAGHEEYYASHEIVLNQTAQPLVLLTLDTSLSLHEIKKQLNYWYSLLTNNCTAGQSEDTCMHLLVIGSHTDKVRREGRDQIYQIVTTIVKSSSMINFHGFIQCDCRYSTSDNLNQLRQSLNTICQSIRLSIKRHESSYSNRRCASLMYHLQQSRSEQVTITVGELCEQIRHLKTPGQTLVQLTDLKLLIQTCNNLSSNGHILFFLHDIKEEKSVLVLDEKVILSEVHACLTTIKEDLSNEIGMLKEDQLKEIFLQCSTIEPDLAIKYLIFTQFCTEVTPDKLISVPGEMKSVKYYFFPNLVRASRSSVLFSAQDAYTRTPLYTWCLKCTSVHQFFTPRFLHTLFIQLTKCEEDAANTEYDIWKNGILFIHDNGCRYIIEVTDQTTRVYLAIQCIEGCESYLVKQRSMLISLIKSLMQKICPAITIEESLLLPQSTYPPDAIEIPLAKVERAVQSGHEYVSFKCGDRNAQRHVKDLLHFDSFYILKDQTLCEIFRESEYKGLVSLASLKVVCSGLKFGRDLVKIIEVMTDQGMGQVKYDQLFGELTKYSIFGDKLNPPTSVHTEHELISTSFSNAPDLEAYLSSLHPAAHSCLELQLDSDHERVEADLYEIADNMLDWEERLSAHLGLTPVDISDIKDMYPFKPVLQRREALRRWKNKQWLQATYGNLLELFVKAEHSMCAKAISVRC